MPSVPRAKMSKKAQALAAAQKDSAEQIDLFAEMLGLYMDEKNPEKKFRKGAELLPYVKARKGYVKVDGDVKHTLEVTVGSLSD